MRNKNECLALLNNSLHIITPYDVYPLLNSGSFVIIGIESTDLKEKNDAETGQVVLVQEISIRPRRVLLKQNQVISVMEMHCDEDKTYSFKHLRSIPLYEHDELRQNDLIDDLADETDALRSTNPDTFICFYMTDDVLLDQMLKDAEAR